MWPLHNRILVFSIGKFIDDAKQIVVPELNYLFSDTLNFRGVFVTVRRLGNKSLTSFEHFLKYGNWIWALNLLTGYFHNCF